MRVGERDGGRKEGRVGREAGSGRTWRDKGGRKGQMKWRGGRAAGGRERNGRNAGRESMARGR